MTWALDDHANRGKFSRAYASEFFPVVRSVKKTAPHTPSARRAPAEPTQPSAVTLTEAEQVLALPDRLLRALADDFVAALAANVQAIVRARRVA